MFKFLIYLSFLVCSVNKDPIAFFCLQIPSLLGDIY